jgi:hypothetical protein
MKTSCLLARDWQQMPSQQSFLAANIVWVVWLCDSSEGSILPGVFSGEVVLLPHEQAYPYGATTFGDDDRPEADACAGLYLDECRGPFSPGSTFRALVLEAAHRFSVEPRGLAVRVLLHLPRVASYTGWITRWHLQRELSIGAEWLSQDVRAARGHMPSAAKFQLRDLDFEVIDSSRAMPILTSLHYLRSARRDSLHFALVDPVDRLPVSLCSLSALEWKCIASQIHAQFRIRQDRVRDLSRVYSVDCAPPNAISALLSKVRAYLRHNMPSIQLLVTAVDPNLGFTGGSYRAANWQQWMTVRARPYLYENGRYVTPRQLREKFGTSSLLELQARHPGRFQRSGARLLDSMIYCCSVTGETQAVPAQDRPRLHR